MPFTVNVGPYQGGNFLASGLSSFGQSVGSAIKDVHTQLDDQRKMEAYNDSVVQHALQNKQITMEDYAKYRDMSRTQKTGFAAAQAANFMEDFRKEQLDSLKQSREASAEATRASAELRTQQAGAFNFEPTEEMKQLARATGNEIIKTGPGKYQVVPYGENGAGTDAQARGVTIPRPCNETAGAWMESRPNEGKQAVSSQLHWGWCATDCPRSRYGAPFYPTKAGRIR